LVKTSYPERLSGPAKPLQLFLFFFTVYSVAACRYGKFSTARAVERPQKALTAKNIGGYDAVQASNLGLITERGMGMSAFRRVLSCVLLLIVPAALFGADQPGAMLYSHGTALLNGDSIPRSSAIFSGDLIQTTADSVANINVTGSTVLVLNDSLVQYEGGSVKLEHGGVTVSTSKLLATHAGAVSVSPAAGGWTEFEVRDVDGRVQIVARKGDLTISDATGISTLPQGQQTTRQESQTQDDSQAQNDNKGKKRKEPAGPAPAATGGILDSPWVIGIGGGAVLAATAWILIQSDNPASPSK